MSPKTERFELRIDIELLDRLDTWRASEDDTPSRAEAIRRLLEAGLAHDNRGRSPTFSDGEKLITMMLVDIYKHLGVEGGTDVDFAQKALLGGHFWALGWEMPGLFHGYADKQRHVRFTLDVLEMWSFIEEAMDSFTTEEKKKIEEEVGVLGQNPKYPGFDGNNESEYLGIARFLVEEMGRFPRLKGRGAVNAHIPTLDTHRRMLEVFTPMSENLFGSNLSTAQVATLLRARIHPSRR